MNSGIFFSFLEVLLLIFFLFFGGGSSQDKFIKIWEGKKDTEKKEIKKDHKISSYNFN